MGEYAHYHYAKRNSMSRIDTLRSVIEALTNTLPTMHKNTTTLGKVNYHAVKDAITDLTALIADMEKTEPVAWQERQSFNVGWSKWYYCDSRLPSSRTERVVDHITYQWRPLYAQPKAELVQEPRTKLWDSQWVNIVNDQVIQQWETSKDDAVHRAVKLTEEAMAKNVTPQSKPLTDDLHWYALNYRTADTRHVQQAWNELEAYVLHGIKE
jgi:hypothetical protein